MKSILESGNNHAEHDRLYEGVYRFFSDKNIVIMICRSGRHRSVANAEMWSNTLARCSRRQHSVSLLHLSGLDFRRNTCAGNCSECSKQSLTVLQAQNEQDQAECLRRVLVPDPVTGLWKRPRPENAEGPAQPVSDKCRGYTCQDEHESRNPVERLGSFNESARALASCLQKRDVSRKTDQSVHVSQFFGEGKGRLGSSDATVTRRSLYRDQAEQATMFAFRDIESASLSSSRGIERKICTSRVN